MKFQWVPKRLTYISGMGEVLVYDIIDNETNETFQSMISMDKKWIRPGMIDKEREQWYILRECHNHKDGRKSYKFNAELAEYTVYDDVINMIENVIFEREVFGIKLCE